MYNNKLVGQDVLEATIKYTKNLQNVTYADLVGLKESSKLVPGQQYRITDYVTTTTQSNTQSAEHVFDVIVTATSKNTLSNDAKACKHTQEDTYLWIMVQHRDNLLPEKYVYYDFFEDDGFRFFIWKSEEKQDNDTRYNYQLTENFFIQPGESTCGYMQDDGDYEPGWYRSNKYYRAILDVCPVIKNATQDIKDQCCSFVQYPVYRPDENINDYQSTLNLIFKSIPQVGTNFNIIGKLFRDSNIVYPTTFAKNYIEILEVTDSYITMAWECGDDTGVDTWLFDGYYTDEESIDVDLFKSLVSNTKDYFENCNLDAWELKYDINNDTSKYLWADDSGELQIIKIYTDDNLWFDRAPQYDRDGNYAWYNPGFDQHKALYSDTLNLELGDDLFLYDENSYREYYSNIIISDTGNWKVEALVGAGKGVIYYMKDEFNNECPYDFKNILFKRWKISASTTTPDLVGKYLAFGTSASGYTVNTSDYKMCYTFNYIDNNTCLDVSLNNPEVVDIVSGASKPISNNVINSWYNMSTLKLNNIVFNAQTFSQGSTHKYFFWDNKIKNNCHDMSFDSGCHTNTFGNSCYDNTFGDSCQSNTFGNNCNYNTFGDNCESNTFGDNCTYNAFGKSGQNNIFGGSCQYNTLGNYCDNNKFGNTISYVTFGQRTTKDELNPQTFNYYNNIIVESNNRYINITGDNTTPSSSNLLKNIVIKSDVKTNNESSTDILNLIFSRNCDYEQTVSKNSSGEIITYSLPDLATSVQNIQLQLQEIESLTDDILS